MNNNKITKEEILYILQNLKAIDKEINKSIIDKGYLLEKFNNIVEELKK